MSPSPRAAGTADPSCPPGVDEALAALQANARHGGTADRCSAAVSSPATDTPRRTVTPGVAAAADARAASATAAVVR